LCTEEDTMKQLPAYILAFLLFLLASSSIALAEGPSDLPEQFMKQVVAGKVAEAVDQYFSTNQLVAQKTQQVQYVKTQIDALFQMLGKPFAYELVTEDILAPSLRRYVYISKHDYHAITWEFFIYKPKDAWIASNMNFNDNFATAGSRK